MMLRPLLFLLLLSLAPLCRCETDSLPKGIQVKNYGGWNECVFFTAPQKPIQVVLAPVIGGRILRYSLNGENIFFENAAAQGKTIANSKGPLWPGGYQCEIGPESIQLPDLARLFLAPHRWRTDADFSANVYSASNELLRLQIEKEIVLAPDTGDLGLIQRLRNVSKKQINCSLWDRTLCKGGGFAFFPLNKNSRFKAGWSLHRQAAGKTIYESDSPFSMQVQVLDGLLIAEANGEPTKLGADSDAGWIAYVHGDLLFVKYFSYFPKGDYTQGGNSVALYFDQRVAELEPLSPEISLQPGNNFSFPEKWTLQRLEKPITTPEQVRSLARTIPPSPFRTTR